ncbi:putative NADH-dependent flavin oxidoreductase [Calycina marina]|uniref:NADH-dependent flavin oxidoreductase n=1 Tax=Calycina marina TaxID=1763456 RepID=A0A9P7Z041_9HELO|nr:putative NADH-dependent flavin oxidoreductase [Calycina marina]
MAPADLPNVAAKGISYFTPEQSIPSGTATVPQSNSSNIPKLFQPWAIRGCTFQNRIMLAPLCQYSAEDGHMTDWHMAHLGGIISRGPGLSMIEATAVTPEGRITPEDVGIWKDSQIAGLKRIVDFAHSQNQKIGIQLAHAGRKASATAPFVDGNATATANVNGWPTKVYAPSAIRQNDEMPEPNAFSLGEIEDLKKAWGAAVERALKAGFDVIEIHNAHGYLLHEFISPVSNKRTDKYGGSFENRTRLTLEIVELTRKAIPDSMPLLLRISATDWLKNTDYEGESWTIKDSVKLAKLIAERGVDLIDVSSGGVHPDQKVAVGWQYQAPLAREIKEAVGDTLAVGVVGNITKGKQANDLLEEGLDLAIAGRMFQKNPGLVWQWAEELEVEISVAKQIGWGFGGRAGRARHQKI